MAMMTLCVSGVVIHRKTFTDFFTFRPDKKPRQLVLDLRNATGVLGLPFHFVISLSGLIIFFAIYFPDVRNIANDGDRRAFNREAYGQTRRRRRRPRRSTPWPPFASSFNGEGQLHPLCLGSPSSDRRREAF